MVKRNQHVVPLGNAWAVKGEGADKASVITSNQKEAIDYAKEVARSLQADIVIHGRDGRIRDRSSFSNNPHAPKK